MIKITEPKPDTESDYKEVAPVLKRPPPLELVIRNTGDIEGIDVASIMDYGPAGSGKTWSLQFVPNLLILDFDDGAKTLRKFSKDYITIPRKSESFGVINKHIEEWVKGYGAVAFDSLTTFRDIIIMHTMRVEGRKKLRIQDYATAREFLIEIIYRVKQDLKVHCLCTAHEAYTPNELTGELWAHPTAITKAQSPEISVHFDEVFHSEVGTNAKGEITYRKRIRSATTYESKSRWLQDQPQYLEGGNYWQYIDKLIVNRPEEGPQTEGGVQDGAD
jgi:hypothetical protein